MEKGARRELAGSGRVSEKRKSELISRETELVKREEERENVSRERERERARSEKVGS